MEKKILYMILGMIVAIIVIAECFSNPDIKTQAYNLEAKVSHKIVEVFDK